MSDSAPRAQEQTPGVEPHVVAANGTHPSLLVERPAPLRNESTMASAGSGKTFALSSRYLQLVLMGAEPQSILASTFTRIAAGEIRDRILERLALAATTESKRDELAKSIHRTNLHRDEILEALPRLTREMHRLQVRTLDSFFASIVKCFALELGIDPASSIVDADLDADLRREAIETMLDERDPQPLINLLRVLTDGSDERRVTEVLDGEMLALYELYREAPSSAWEAVSFWNPLDEDDLADAISELEETDPGSNGHVRKAHRGDCCRAREARPQSVDGWSGFLSKGLACAIVQRGGVFHRHPLDGALRRAYEPLIAHAKAVVRNSLAGRTRSTRDLLARFHERYEDSKARHKAMTFADVTAKMADAMKLGQADEICFRLDATLRHILLDEMQDTSHQQWQALEEIVRSIISEPPPDRSFFCVGDVKQSIYGWREACPEILAHMPSLIEQLGGEARSGEPLVKNWRSSPIVLDTVDRVLCSTSDNPAMEECLDAAGAWDAAYLPHVAHHETMPGYVELRVAPRAGEDDEKQYVVRLRHAADLIARLYQDVPHASIGVLTRTNKTVNRLLYELGPANKNLDVAGRGGGALTDSAAVNAILDLLRLADHPGHTIAAFNVIHSPLGEAIGFTDGEECWRISRNVRAMLLEEGYAKTIGKWITKIGSRTDARQLRRLVQLQQLAAQFDARLRKSLRADDFLDLVEATKTADAGAARVQVMTVHQSKGLEFDIVVLADLDQAIVQPRGIKMIVERDTFGNVQRIARHGGKDIWPLFDDLHPMYEQQMARMATESLCLLYVAMTRARHALHMVIDPPGAKEKAVPKTLAGIVRVLAEASLDPEAVVYQRGHARWWDDAGGSRSRATEDEAKSRDSESSGEGKSPIVLARASGDVPRGRSGESASALHETDADERAIAWALRLPNKSARDRGTAIHAMFESIEWIEEFVPDRATLASIALRAAPRCGVEWANEQVGAFLDMLERPEVRDALSRGNAKGRSQVWREVPIARLVRGAVRRDVIDRLTVRFDESGNIADAAVLDFKTDAVSSGDLEERLEHYRPQLEAYRTAAASMLSAGEAAIAMRLIFVNIGAVVEL